jgi:hypothetical protein
MAENAALCIEHTKKREKENISISIQLSFNLDRNLIELIESNITAQ